MGNADSSACAAERECGEDCNLTLWELSQEEKLVTLHKKGRKNSGKVLPAAHKGLV